MKKVLTFTEYTLRYNKRLVLGNISFDTYEREVHAICGMRDSGILCLKNALLRRHPLPFREIGDVMLNGTLLTKLGDTEMQYIRLLDIGEISLGSNDFANGFLSVRQFLLSPFNKAVKKTKQEIYIDAIRIFELMGIKKPTKLFRKKLSRLSKKDLRAVMTASAICTDPSLVILSSFGKQDAGDEFYALITKICKIKNIALLILTDDISSAMKYAEKVTILDKGQVAETFMQGEAPASSQAKFLLSPADFYEKMQFTGDEIISSANNCFVSKHSAPLSFDLYRGEIIGIQTRFVQRVLRILSGKATPKIGNVLKGGSLISKIKPADRKIFVINNIPGKMFLPATKIANLVTRFGKGVSKTDISSLFALLDIEDKITASDISDVDDFTCIRLCLALSCMSGADTVILPGISEFCSEYERYALMQYVKKLCAHKMSFIFIADDNAFLSHVADAFIALD